MATTATTRPEALTRGGTPTIFVSDMARAVRFYEGALGMKVMYRGGEGFTMLDAGGGLQVGLHTPGEHTPPPGARGGMQLGLNVAKPIDEVVHELTRRDVMFHGPVIDDGGAVKLAFFADPDGNVLYLCEVLM